MSIRLTPWLPILASCLPHVGGYQIRESFRLDLCGMVRATSSTSQRIPDNDDAYDAIVWGKSNISVSSHESINHVCRVRFSSLASAAAARRTTPSTVSIILDRRQRSTLGPELPDQSLRANANWPHFHQFPSGPMPLEVHSRCVTTATNPPNMTRHRKISPTPAGR